MRLFSSPLMFLSPICRAAKPQEPLLPYTWTTRGLDFVAHRGLDLYLRLYQPAGGLGFVPVGGSAREALSLGSCVFAFELSPFQSAPLQAFVYSISPTYVNQSMVLQDAPSGLSRSCALLFCLPDFVCG